MKKILPAAVLAAILAPTAASAALYAGADFVANSLDMRDALLVDIPQSALGVNIHVGDRFGKHFAVELGYEAASENLTAYDNDIHVNKLTGDGIFYIPVLGTLNYLLTAGVSEVNYGDGSYRTINTIDPDGDTHSYRNTKLNFGGDELDWRAGMGFAFVFADSFEFRVLGRYQPLSMGGRASNVITFATGLNFFL